MLIIQLLCYVKNWSRAKKVIKHTLYRREIWKGKYVHSILQEKVIYIFIKI